MTPRLSSPRGHWVLLLLLTACSDCDDSADTPRDPDSTDAGPEGGTQLTCLGNPFVCDGDIAISCTDSGVEPQNCAETGSVCNVHTGCASCVAGSASCSDGQATWCTPEGKLLTFECDPLQGLTCTPGGCTGACSPSGVHGSYIGCDYYPTVTLNPVWSGFPFAVAVSNASNEPTQVTITRGDQIVVQETVAADELRTFALDWVAELKGGDVDCSTPPGRGPTRLVQQGAYRVRTDRPVTVYQFSPLEYELAPVPDGCPVLSECSVSPETRCLSYTNDASILLPATALTGSYTALAWPTQTYGASSSDGSGFVAITATEDGTRVQVLGHGSFVPGAGIDAEGRGTLTLDRGDVLQLVAAADSDPSGTRIRADKPVQVIGGQSCAYVPSVDVLNCDHIEEVMLPEDTLGSDYLVSLPVYADLEHDVPLVVRVAAISDDTEVQFDPALRGPAVLAGGEVLEFELSGDNAQHLRIQGTRPLLVSTYMQGQEAIGLGGSVGDPSMSVAVPTEQFRTEYLFTAPVSYAVNIANIVAPEGSRVHLDGSLLSTTDFAPIGSSGYGVARIMLDASTSAHTVVADREIGLTVYGYGLYTSYMYPGGADLERITEPVVF